MQHAIRRLNEELLTLKPERALVRADPSAAGGLQQANAIAQELLVEIEEVSRALAVLKAAQVRAERGVGLASGEIEPGRHVRADWDKALFEPWAKRKARLQLERTRQTHA